MKLVSLTTKVEDLHGFKSMNIEDDLKDTFKIEGQSSKFGLNNALGIVRLQWMKHWSIKVCTHPRQAQSMDCKLSVQTLDP